MTNTNPTQKAIEALGKLENMDNGVNTQLFKTIRASLTASEQKPSASEPVGWQPIQTAPKKGTVVDLWIDCGDCQFRAVDFVWRDYRDEGAAWRGEITDCILEDSYLNAKLEPTHWRARPVSPHEESTTPQPAQVSREALEDALSPFTVAPSRAAMVVLALINPMQEKG